EDEDDKDHKTKKHIPYKVSMDTNAGKVRFKNTAVLKKEKTDDEESWNIDWNPSFILNQLSEDKKVKKSNRVTKQG
ncbi:penicillin-binding transpeptidase domain-containing protein, partial [Bacillus vallismortis]|nr:penicillin-binding transpeptidase domain-containing protein [Bacillus vallismortis]